MNDLLSSVKGRASTRASGGEDVDEIDVEEGFTAPPTEAEREMQAFFEKVEDIKKDMIEIKTLQKDINTMHEKSKTIVKTKEMQKQREQMQVSLRFLHRKHACGGQQGHTVTLLRLQ